MKKIILSVAGILLCMGFTYAATPITPVVQVRTYDVLQGKYPQELWNGSASIISKKGVLLTNNHVAQNQDEENALGFIICMTTQAGKAPECNYTAHIITRNVDMDLALLQLDAKDINGNTVDFSSLPVLEIDYVYQPKDSDKVQAIGYPGIGGDTITTTNGTVAGTVEYNGFTYIKTDATISHGNSGGPMLSAAGKQIGLNTFGVSDIGEGLGYGLLLSEAKAYIEQYQNTPSEESILNVDLGSYAKQVDALNKNKKLQFPWVSYIIPAEYEVKNFVDSISFIQTPKDIKDVQTSFLGISISATPSLDTEKLFFYYLEKLGVYSKSYAKLVPTTIGGKKFYRILSKWDQTGGEGGGVHVYVGQLNKNALVAVIMNITGESEKKLAEVKAEKERILKNISFTSTEYVPSFDGEIVDPGMTFVNPQKWVGEFVMQPSEWGDQGVFNLYLYDKNLHDSISIIASKTTKATNIQKIYNADYKDTPKNMKSLGKFQGHDAFIVCDEQGKIGEYLYNSIEVDENNKPLQQYGCVITTIIPSLFDVPYRVDITLVGPRTSKQQSLSTMLNVISKEISLGNGKTTLPNLFTAGNTTIYKDLRDQTNAYRKKLDSLVGYGLLKKSDSFNPYTPVTYGLFTEKYLQFVHNISIADSSCTTTVCMLQNKKISVNGADISLYELFSDVKINWNGYVDVTKAGYYLYYMSLKLAGVVLPVYSEDVLNTMKNDPENPDYKDAFEKLDSYNAALYGSKKIGYDEVLGDDYSAYYKSFFRPTKTVSYVPKKGIVVTPYYATTPLIFDAGLQTSVECIYAIAGQSCIDKSLAAKTGTFQVLDKATMIEALVNNMDFGLFDPEMAKKKEADVGEDNLIDALEE